MADIRQYRREKSHREENNVNDRKFREDYEAKLRRHRIRLIKFGLIMAGMIIAVILVFCIVKQKSVYSSYSIISRMRRTESGYAQYISFGNNIVRCSKDGIAAFSYQGEQIWNSTYELNNIVIDYSGSYLAVAESDGNKIYTFNENGHIADINTALPIIQISVSRGGYVVAVLEDKNADYINMYTMDGEKAYTIKKTIGIDGVPVSVSVSDDGEKLVAAFTGINGNSIKTSVVFYNFNEVGQNENERVVGGYDYGDVLVGRVEFINSTTAVAYGENKVSLYSIREYPNLIREIEINYPIEYIFSGESYIGIIHSNTDSDKNILEVYNTSGNIAYSGSFDKSYSNFSFCKDSILMYGESECMIMNINGKIKFRQTFEDGISSIIPVNYKDEFIYINMDYVRKIKLK